MIAGLASRRVDELLAPRTEANRDFFARGGRAAGACCHRMAERFARGGRLVALGRSPIARSDARHVAVEFVHPVIVGKRALPAIGLTAGGRAAAPPGGAVASPTTSRSPTESRRRLRTRSARRSGWRVIGGA